LTFPGRILCEKFSSKNPVRAGLSFFHESQLIYFDSVDDPGDGGQQESQHTNQPKPKADIPGQVERISIYDPFSFFHF